MSKKEFIRRIPQEYQKQLELTRLKISLIKCRNKTEVEKAKMFLYFQSEKIFENINDYNKLKAKSFLKSSLYEYLLNNSNLNVKSLSTKIVESIDIITVINIMDLEMKKRKVIFINQQKEKKKAGVDITIKKDMTYNAYVTIKNHLLSFKVIVEKDYKELKNDDFEDFKYFLLEKNISLSSIRNYFKHLKAIFNRLIESDKITYNPVKVPSVKSLEDDKLMFDYDEITTILANLEDEESLIFKTLLYTGMRMDELSSLKKENIKNDCFYFFDSKNYFKKIVPIHASIIADIKNIMDNINSSDYIFKNILTGTTRVDNIRNPLNNFFKELGIQKTLHKTRATFITYLNFYNENFNSNDIKVLTHALTGEDNKSYVVAKNIEKLRTIVNSIDLKKLQEIEKLM